MSPCSGKTPETPQAEPSRYPLLFIGIIALCVITTVLNVYTFFVGTLHPKSILDDKNLFQLQLLDKIQAESDRADHLAQQGQHFEAAKLYIDISGAYHLLPPVFHSSTPSPLPYERLAQLQLKLIDKDQPYRQLLQALYPDHDFSTWDRAISQTASDLPPPPPQP